MTTSLIVLHTAIAIVGVVLLIMRARIDPVIALMVAALYLGIAGGLGFSTTVETIASGFGSLMADVGLLIGFGVLLGSLLLKAGVLGQLIAALLRAFGPRRLPYAFAVSMSSIFPAIYPDVQLVLAAPLARSAARQMPRNGKPLMAAALTAGIECGNLFVVPGLAAVTVAALLGVPLGSMLLYGVGIGIGSAVLATLFSAWLLSRGMWDPERDEEPESADLDGLSTPDPASAPAPQSADLDGLSTLGPGGAPTATEVRAPGSLIVGVLPMVVPLLLIATGAIAKALGVESPLVSVLGEPVFALFVGLVGAYLLARRRMGEAGTAEAMRGGFGFSGQILLLTGVGGALGKVVRETPLADVMAGFFSADAGVPVLVAVLLTWFTAAVLHIAIGSVNVAAVTTAGILAPVMSTISVPLPVMALVIVSGALFAIHVNSNFFWMFQSLLGLTTRGTLKTLTFVTCITSVISLVLLSVVALVVS